MEFDNSPGDYWTMLMLVWSSSKQNHCGFTMSYPVASGKKQVKIYYPKDLRYRIAGTVFL